MSNKKNSEWFDIRGLIDSYLKRWWWFAISVIACCALAYMFTKIKKPEYEIRANVLVTDDNTSSLTSMSGLSDLFGSSANVEDEIYVITSHTVLSEAAKALGINCTHKVKQGFLQSYLAYPEFPVQVYPQPGVCDTLLSTIVFKTKIHENGTADVTAKVDSETIGKVKKQKLPVTLKTDYGSFVIDTTACYPSGTSLKSTISLTGYDVVAEDLFEDISCHKASKKSNMLKMRIASPNPEYGEAVLNKVMEVYNKLGVEHTNMQGEKTLDFINNRLAMISGDLKDAEEDIETYKRNHNIVDVQAEATYNMTLRGQAERQLVSAETRSELIKMARDFLTQPENAYQLIPFSGDAGSANDAIAQYNGMIARRMDLMQNARGDNIALQQLNAQIDAMRTNINATLAHEYETTLAMIREAKSENNKLLDRLGNVPAQEREFLNLKRQQEVKQQLYLFLLQRREETAMVIANAIPKGRIIDEAYTLSEPLGLSNKMILLIAFVFGLFIPPVILYVKYLLRNKFETRKEVEQRTDMPVLGEICVDNSGQSLVVTPQSTTSTTELFRMVRSSLMFMLNDRNDKVVLVTSTRSGEGKSFVSVNLAASLALLGKKVLLIGMDIRNPQLANYLKLSHPKGLTNYLSTPGMPLGDIVIRGQVAPNLDVIVGGPVPPNPGELLTSQSVDDLFAELRSLYDYIIVDSAPVGMVSDTFNLARISDATVYVCRANYTTLSDIDFLNNIYETKRLNKPALVVNGTTVAAKYGYGYGYGQQNGKKGKRH